MEKQSSIERPFTKKKSKWVSILFVTGILLSGCGTYLKAPPAPAKAIDDDAYGLGYIEDVGQIVEIEYNGYKPNQTNKQTTTSDSATVDVKKCLDIKGNKNKYGDMTYHLPTGTYYNSIKPEAVFCTEKDAKGAGYKKSVR